MNQIISKPIYVGTPGIVQSIGYMPQIDVEICHRSIGNVIQTVTYGASRDGALDLTPVVEAISKLFIKSVMFSNHAVEFFPWCASISNSSLRPE